NTVCSPISSRSFGRRSICRNFSYEFFCTSIRFGIGIEVLILEKSTLSGARPVSDIGFRNSVTAGRGSNARYLETKNELGPCSFSQERGRPAGYETLLFTCSEGSTILDARAAR